MAQSAARLRKRLFDAQIERRKVAGSPPYILRDDPRLEVISALDVEIEARARGLKMTNAQAWKEFDRLRAIFGDELPG